MFWTRLYPSLWHLTRPMVEVRKKPVVLNMDAAISDMASKTFWLADLAHFKKSNVMYAIGSFCFELMFCAAVELRRSLPDI